MLEPFVCNMHEPWARLLGITSVYLVPCSVGTLISRVADWVGAVIQMRDVPVLKEYMRQVLEPLIHQTLIDPQQAQELGKLTRMMLPSVNLTMRPSCELCVVYRSSGVGDDVLRNDRVLHHELSPEIFDCRYLGLLGVRNVRSVVEQRIDNVVCTDAAAAPIVARLTRIMKLPLFAELLRVAAYGTAPVEGAAPPSDRFERLLQGVSIVLCTTLSVFWKHDEMVQTEDHSVVLAPEYALETTTADSNTTMSFYVLVKRFDGSIDDELIRRGVVSSLCEALSLPAATRRDDVSMALRCHTAEALSTFLDSRRSTRVVEEEAPIEPEIKPATPPIPPPRRMEQVSVPHGGGAIFRSRGRSPYQSDGGAKLPAEITKHATLHVDTTDDDCSTQCSHPPVALKRSPHAASNGCPLYTDSSWECQTSAQQATTLSHLETLSRVLFTAAGHMNDPAAAQHCVVYYTSTNTNTLAFNADGVLAFNIGYYARQPDPHHWTVVFLHEYSHNESKGHGFAFLTALQFHCARYIAAHTHGSVERQRTDSASRSYESKLRGFVSNASEPGSDSVAVRPHGAQHYDAAGGVARGTHQTPVALPTSAAVFRVRPATAGASEKENPRLASHVSHQHEIRGALEHKNVRQRLAARRLEAEKRHQQRLAECKQQRP